MLRPGFSLVGLTGMVYLSAPGIPPGCSTVIVDWKAHGYTPENGYADDSLPPLVNVPTQHLTIVDENAQAAPKAEPAPKFKPKKDDDEPERPKLRLV